MTLYPRTRLARRGGDGQKVGNLAVLDDVVAVPGLIKFTQMNVLGDKRHAFPLINDFPSYRASRSSLWYSRTGAAGKKVENVICVFDRRRELDGVVTRAPYDSRILFVGNHRLARLPGWCCRLGWRMGKDVFEVGLPILDFWISLPNTFFIFAKQTTSTWDGWVPGDNNVVSPGNSNLRNVDQMSFEFQLGIPFKPYEQLMGALPIASMEHIPIAYRLDLNEKKRGWEAIVKIPSIKIGCLKLSQRMNIVSHQRSNIEALGGTGTKFRFNPDETTLYPSSIPGFPPLLALRRSCSRRRSHGRVPIPPYPPSTYTEQKAVTIIPIKNTYEGKKSHERWSMKGRLWIGHFLQEGFVVAVSDSMFKYEKFMVTPGSPAKVISTSHGSNHWKSKVEWIQGRYSTQCDVIAGDLEVALHVRPLKVGFETPEIRRFFPSEKAEIDKFKDVVVYRNASRYYPSFKRKALKVIDYSRKEGRNWDYSEKVIELLREYKYLMEMVQIHGQVREIKSWLKSKLDKETVAEIEALADTITKTKSPGSIKDVHRLEAYHGWPSLNLEPLSCDLQVQNVWF
ncbi:hypothetical protein BYT27DRAFT_7213248 [Phlegmacium glaucopus]|nr:hypothetical protein BYT27DRAFT_7213248 [Phlegmacium glaucopus]